MHSVLESSDGGKTGEVHISASRSTMEEGTYPQPVKEKVETIEVHDNFHLLLQYSITQVLVTTTSKLSSVNSINSTVILSI